MGMKKKKSTARKTSTVPSRVYSYGVRAPDVGADRFNDQLRLAWRYKNELTAIERTRRERVDAEHRDATPLLTGLATCLDLAEVGYETALETFRLAKQNRNSGTVAGADEPTKREMLTISRQHIRRVEKLWNRAKARERKRNPGLVTRIQAHTETSYVEIRDARGHNDLYWGTYLVREAAAKQSAEAPAPPAFKRWEGGGQIAVQIQHGMSVAELLGCQDTRLRLAIYPGTTRARYGRIWIRAGSGANGRARAPVWVSAEIKLHRPLPEDARIMWARLQRYRVGSVWRHEVQFILEAMSLADAVPGSAGQHGSVAIDIGWRKIVDNGVDTGRVRMAYLVDSAGMSGPVELPYASARGGHATVRARQVADIRSIRDQNFERARDAVVNYFRTASTPVSPAVAGVAHGAWQWRAPRRLANLAHVWQSNRPDDDEGMLNLLELELYLAHDRHLWDWEGAQSSRLRACIKDAHRQLAVALAKRYAIIHIENMEKFDLSSRIMAQRPYADEEEEPAEKREQRRTARLVSPGIFREELKKAAAKYGSVVVEHEPAATTEHCDMCGVEGAWLTPARTAIVRVCGACGVAQDQDEMAAKNLLALASGAVMGPPAGVLANMRIAEEIEEGGQRKGGSAKRPKAPRRDRSHKAA